MTSDVQDLEEAAGEPRLRRSIGTTQLALYALGSMVGSGIYGLIGKAAGQAGTAVWLSFIVALFAALLTSLSYASLGSRYPRAGGAAYVTERAFGIPVLSFTIGLALIASGLTSVATQSKIFAAILADVTGLDALPPTAIAAGFLMILGGIVFRGIRESMWVNVLCTLLEVSGLLLVIASGFSYWGTVDYFETPPDRADSTLLVIVLQASVLAFFAFIGFEDAINVAEECKNPERTIPAGILIATLTAAVLYVAVAITSVSVVPWQALAAAPSPLKAQRTERSIRDNEFYRPLLRRQYRTRQLRHRFAIDLWHGGPGSTAKGVRKRACNSQNTAHRHSGSAGRAVAARCQRQHRRPRRGDGAVAARRLHRRQRSFGRFETTAWGATRPIRSSVAFAHCRNGRLRSAARNAAVKSRMESARTRRADPVG